jgi:putative DNA primase/helicase
MASEALAPVVPLDTTPPDAAAAKRRKRTPPPPDAPGNITRLTEDFAYIFGTDTVVGPNPKNGALMIQRIGALRHAYGRAVKFWLESPHRKTILAEDVIFDPSDAARPWNLFSGIPLRPAKGPCTLILELLDYLVGGNPVLRDWVTKWTAYPLQHVGTKMATAIVMRGPQGGGKNLFWEAVRDIYGPFGTLITQSEIESVYNDWCSAKLFVIGNEVLSRREKWTLGGKLKNLVTEAFIPIQAKFLPSRVERNCANLVFLSNDLLPVPLEEGNRRYLVIDAPAPHPAGADFYRAVAEELRNGGLEAFYHYLLTLPLGDFGPHTKPVATEAFQESLELSLGPSELFVRRWRDGDVDVLKSGQDDYTIGAGTIEDLYAIFQRWCQRHGERHVDTQTLFARTLTVKGIRKKRMRLDTGSKTRQVRVYWDPERVPDGNDNLDAWLAEQCGYANGCAYPTGG